MFRPLIHKYVKSTLSSCFRQTNTTSRYKCETSRPDKLTFCTLWGELRCTDTSADTTPCFLSKILEVPHSGRWLRNFARNRFCSETSPPGFWFSPPPGGTWRFCWRSRRSRRTWSFESRSAGCRSSPRPSPVVWPWTLFPETGSLGQVRHVNIDRVSPVLFWPTALCDNKRVTLISQQQRWTQWHR